MFAQMIKSTERRRKEERYKPSVRGKETSRARKNITVNKIKRKISRRQTTIQFTARQTLQYKNEYNQP